MFVISLTVHLASVFRVFIAATVMVMVCGRRGLCGRHGIGPIMRTIGPAVQYAYIPPPSESATLSLKRESQRHVGGLA